MTPSGEGSAATVVVGAGFLGSAVARALAAAGRAVTVLTRTRPHPQALAPGIGVRLVVGDAASPDAVREALDEVGAVVFCAGSALPAEVETDPASDLRESLVPLLGVLDGLRRHPGVPILFLSSGGTVYGDPDVLPVPEHAPLHPLTAYATGKVMAETYLDTYRRRHGIPATALRCSNVYGVGQTAFRSQGIVATLLAAAASRQPVTLYGDGSAVRDHVAVDDVADAVVALLDRPALPAAVNVGSGVGTRLDKLVSLVESVTGRQLRTRRSPARSTDLDRVVLDIGLLRQLIDFEPASLVDGVSRLWEAMLGSATLRT